MQLYRELLTIACGFLLTVTLSGCNGDSTDTATVTVVGMVDDGTETSPLGNARCQYIGLSQQFYATTIANAQGQFRLRMPSEATGFIGCNPSAFPNLILAAYISTKGVTAGTIIPANGFEEVSPGTTVVANILAQTSPEDPQGRKEELMAALDAGELDLTMLAGAATELFNQMLRKQVLDEGFSSIDGEASADSPDTADGGGAAGAAGDGSNFSPFVNTQCIFASDRRGSSALEDFWRDGRLNRPNLLSLNVVSEEPAALRAAFERWFPNGIQPLVGGKPLRTRTGADGQYFLPVRPREAGFISCAPEPNLSVTRFMPPRQAGELLMAQDVSPPRQVFTSLILPHLAQPDQRPTQENFVTDIGDLSAITGPVRVETVDAPTGPRVGDADGDGLSCSLDIRNPAEGSVQWVAAGAVSFLSIALFKALLVEAPLPGSSTFEKVLTDVLRRTDENGRPQVEITPSDLTSLGVSEPRATELAGLLNDCVQAGIIGFVGPPLLVRMVGAGRLRIQVVSATTGSPLPDAQVQVTGEFKAFEDGGSGCPSAAAAVELMDDLIVCNTNVNGQVTFVLLGKKSVDATPVTVTVTSPDGTVTNQVAAVLVPPVTVDVTVALSP